MNAMKIMPENILDCDIIVLTETFLTEEISLPGYYALHTLATQGDRGRPKGGITCLIKPELVPCSIVYKSDNALTVKTKYIFITCVYFQPYCTEQFIIETINDAMEMIPNDEPAILIGDLNCRTDKKTEKSTLVLEHIKSEGLHLVNNPTDPTYIAPNGTSVIDLMFTNSQVKEISKKSKGTPPPHQ